jgi:predicted permease
MAHLRLALRTLLRTPFVTAVAVASLAFGIGANAAIFSLFDHMLLRSLPVAEPEQLVNLGAPGPKPGSQSCSQQGPCSDVFSYAMFRDLEKVQEPFVSLAAHVSFGANLSYRGQTMTGDGLLVSGSYFPALGIQPAAGRLFTPDDDRTVASHFVVVLSEAYWRTRFASNPQVINDTLSVNGQPMTIVGIAPRGFTGTTLGSQPQVYVPLTMRGLMQPGFRGFENRRSYWAYVFARLKPGVSIEQARAAINAPYRAIVNDVEVPLQQGMSEQTLAQFKAKTITVVEGRRGQSDMHEEATTPLILLLSVTGLVLLIACANIANLLLVRGAGRAGEMAVRLSIGANRRQLIGQLLLESLLLSTIGAALGIVVSQWTLKFIGALLPPEAAATIAFGIDSGVMLFCAAMAIGTGLISGLFPSLHSTRPSLLSTLKEDAGQKGAARGARRFRTALATVQIALSMALLVAAGLFMRSLVNVTRVELGVQAENVITFNIAPELNGYTPERSRALFERIEDELAAMPGVTDVTASMVPILGGSNWGSSVSVQGFAAGPDTDTHANYNEVGPGFFRTLGMPLIKGREFTRADGPNAAKVAIVNESFARKFNLETDVVGKRMGQSTGNAAKLDVEIVGFVKDAKYSEVKDEIPPLFFLPYRQDSGIGRINFYVRSALDPRQLMPGLTATMARLDPNLPVDGLKTLEQQVRENVFLDRMISTLAAAFAVLATMLAGIGLYGVLAYTVAQRTREIGVRMALGADAVRVRSMVLRQVGVMTAIGGVFGLAAAFGLGRLAQSLLYQMEGSDPLVFGLATVVLVLVAFAAGYVPAARAAKIDPMLALRYE